VLQEDVRRILGEKENIIYWYLEEEK
jgi:hypothetical protein